MNVVDAIFIQLALYDLASRIMLFLPSFHLVTSRRGVSFVVCNIYPSKMPEGRCYNMTTWLNKFTWFKNKLTLIDIWNKTVRNISNIWCLIGQILKLTSGNRRKWKITGARWWVWHYDIVVWALRLCQPNQIGETRSGQFLSCLVLLNSLNYQGS